MRKILYVDYNVGRELLSGDSLVNLIVDIRNCGFDVFAVVNRDCETAELIANHDVGLAILQHGVGRWPSRLLHGLVLPLRAGVLILKVRPSLIHANNAIACRAFVPFALLFRIPIIVHFRNSSIPPRTGLFALAADLFACVSRSTRDYVIPMGKMRRSTVVYDALDMERFSRSSELSAMEALVFPIGTIVVGMVGRLTMQKGQIDFIAMAHEISGLFPNVVFVHAGGIPKESGSDPYQRILISRSVELVKRGKFIWLPYINDVAPFWAGVDIAVVPSAGPEALGRVVIEAMAMGRPVVASRSGGPEEIIEDKVTGRLYKMGDVAELTLKIKGLLEDMASAKSMGRTARDTARYRFGRKEYTSRIVHLYRGLISSEPGKVI